MLKRHLKANEMRELAALKRGERESSVKPVMQNLLMECVHRLGRGVSGGENPSVLEHIF